MADKTYYYCIDCVEIVYRLIGHQYGDGQVDSDDSPVYLLAGADDLHMETKAADLPKVHCGCY